MSEEIVESEDSSFLSSCPSNKSIHDNSSLSECEGIQTYCFSRTIAILLNLDTDSTSDSPLWTNPSDSKIHTLSV